MKTDREPNRGEGIADIEREQELPIAKTGDDPGVIFRLEVQMGPSHLTAVRRLVVDLAQPIVGRKDVAARLALATHELLENAVKYAADPRRLISLQLLADTGRTISITVINASNQALYESLKARLDQLNAATDRQQNYHSMISHSMQQESGSGLGLARIYAEAGMSLQCELKGDLLFVRAEADMGDMP